MKQRGPTLPTRLAAILATVLSLTLLAAWGAGLPRPRVERLVRQLRSAEDAERRYTAAQKLGEMGESARPAVPALIDALQDEGSYVTTAMLVFPQEHYVRDAAYQALKRIRGPETIDGLVALIAEQCETDWRVSSMAARLLGELGVEARPAAPRLLEAVDGCRQGEVVKLSLAALAAMEIQPGSSAAARARRVLPQFCHWRGEGGATAASLLYHLCPGDDEVLGLYVTAMLADRSPHSAGLIPINSQTTQLLIDHLGDGTRAAAMQRLADAEPLSVVPALRQALRRGEPLVRAGAASVLARHGLDAAEAEGDLVTLLEDEDAAVRRASAEALWHTARRVDGVVVALADATTSGDPAARQAAQDFIDQRGEADAWSAAPLVQWAVSAHPRPQRLAALELLSRIGGSAVEGHAELLELLRDPDSDIQRAAAEVVAPDR